MEGGEKGLTGVVKDVNGANVTVVLEALPGQLAIVELYKAKQLVKHFVVGDHVLIVGGKFKVWKTRKKKNSQDSSLFKKPSEKGQTGLVSSVFENLVTVVDDSTLETRQVLRLSLYLFVFLKKKKKSQVLSRDIQKSVSVATGLLKLGNYNLHDLVRMAQKSVGVIVKIERDSFRILDQ